MPRFDWFRFRIVEGTVEPGKYARLIYTDHRGGPQLRVSHTLLNAAARMEKDNSAVLVANFFENGYTSWLAASVVLYPLFWRGLLSGGETTFVCDCGGKRCPLPILACWLKKRGATQLDEVARL